MNRSSWQAGLCRLRAAATTRAGTGARGGVFRGNQTALGQPPHFPGRDCTVVVVTYEIPLGAKLPLHRHPQQCTAYALAGNLCVSTLGGRSWQTSRCACW